MQSQTKKATVLKVREKQKLIKEQIQRFEQFRKRNLSNVQKKYMRSIVNKLYIFPRNICQDTITSSSQSADQEITMSYNLKSQNHKNQRNQTKIPELCISKKRQKKIKQYNSVRSQQSVHSVQDGVKTLKTNKRKSKNIQIILDGKKRITSRVKDNSQRKLWINQYSLDNCLTKTDGHNGLIVSFLGQKKHQINISYSGKKIKTQIC